MSSANGCSFHAFAVNKTIMREPQPLSRRYVLTLCGIFLTPLVLNHF